MEIFYTAIYEGTRFDLECRTESAVQGFLESHFEHLDAGEYEYQLIKFVFDDNLESQDIDSRTQWFYIAPDFDAQEQWGTWNHASLGIN